MIESKGKSAAEMLAEHKKLRAELMAKDEAYHFSRELQLDEAEKRANERLVKMREEVADNELLNQTIHNYFEFRPKVEGSQFFSVLDKMPKGGVHHIHSMAAHCLDVFLDITYDDRVYYSDKYKMFKVFTAPDFIEEGYQSCNQMRKFYADPKRFDAELKKGMLLNQQTVYQGSPQEIWKSFQHFFAQFTDVGKYQPFQRRLIKHLLESCVKQNVLAVEIRHTPGMIYNDEMHLIPVEEELSMIADVIDEVRKEHPTFEACLVMTGLKLLGNRHIEKVFCQIQKVLDSGNSRLINLLKGFDLANQEEFSKPLYKFAKSLTANQKLTLIQSGEEFPFYLRCGETHDRNQHNIQDAIALGSKRIGHAFQLQIFPGLVEEVIRRDICVECCPLSNHLLGFTRDLRTHPMSHLLTKGVQVSISSDDPGFFGYEGVTLDFVYACGAWNLDLRDLKKLSLNGIDYSSFSPETKQQLTQEFHKRWALWIQHINALPEKSE
jgi:adenosine deaminase CECR1